MLTFEYHGQTVALVIALRCCVEPHCARLHPVEMVVCAPSSIVMSCVPLLAFTGIAVGHVYYFLEDVFPNKPGGFRILKTPGIL